MKLKLIALVAAAVAMPALAQTPPSDTLTEVISKGVTLFGLVNNAGVAVPAPLAHMPIDEFRTQMEINLTGQLIVTQAFLPLLGMDRSLKGKPGRLINMSSTSGKRGARH